MSTKKALIIVGVILGLIVLSGVVENVSKSNRPAPAAAQPAPKKAEPPQETPCTPLYAYVLSKGVVEQAARDAKSIVFPLFKQEFVEQQGEWFLVTASFIRNNARVPYMVSLRCVGGQWEMGNAQVNNVRAFPGANL